MHWLQLTGSTNLTEFIQENCLSVYRTENREHTRDKMRDREIGDNSTGSDYYFEKIQRYPEFSSTTIASLSLPLRSPGRFVLLPSHFKNENSPSQTRFEYTSRLLPLTSKTFQHSPTNSPSSNGTGETSSCTEYDDQEDDDLNSCCGSLTYSVESWAHDQHSHLDEFYQKYHTTGEISNIKQGTSLYSVEHANQDCCSNDLCFQLFAVFQDHFQKFFPKSSSSIQDVYQECDYESYQ